MARRGWASAALLLVVLLAGRAAALEACSKTSMFVALPTAVHGPTGGPITQPLATSDQVFLIDGLRKSSAESYCRHLPKWEGSYVGSVRTKTLNELGLGLLTIVPHTGKICQVGSCIAIAAIECVRPGAAPCGYDANGNYGYGNTGYRSYGAYNGGVNNTGTFNTGFHNVGSGNKGQVNVGCENAGSFNRGSGFKTDGHRRRGPKTLLRCPRLTTIPVPQPNPLPARDPKPVFPGVTVRVQSYTRDNTNSVGCTGWRHEAYWTYVVTIAMRAQVDVSRVHATCKPVTEATNYKPALLSITTEVKAVQPWEDPDRMVFSLGTFVEGKGFGIALQNPLYPVQPEGGGWGTAYRLGMSGRGSPNWLPVDTQNSGARKV